MRVRFAHSASKEIRSMFILRVMKNGAPAIAVILMSPLSKMTI